MAALGLVMLDSTMKKPIYCIIAGYIAILSNHLLDSLPPHYGFAFYLAAIFSAFILSTQFFVPKPFISATFVVLGVFIGIIMSIIIFPKTSEGFERNLWPIEIILHLMLSSIICFLSAVIWNYFHEKT